MTQYQIQLLDIPPWSTDIDTWRRENEEKGRRARRYQAASATSSASRSERTAIAARGIEERARAANAASRRAVTPPSPPPPRDESPSRVPVYMRLDPDELRRLYVNEKLSLKQVGVEMGCSSETIVRALDYNKIPRRQMRARSSVKGDISSKIVKLYRDEFFSTTEIAAELHVSRRRISQILHDYGVPLRTNASVRAEYQKKGVLPGDVRSWCEREGYEVSPIGYPSLQLLQRYLATRLAA